MGRKRVPPCRMLAEIISVCLFFQSLRFVFRHSLVGICLRKWSESTVCFCLSACLNRAKKIRPCLAQSARIQSFLQLVKVLVLLRVAFSLFRPVRGFEPVHVPLEVFGQFCSPLWPVGYHYLSYSKKARRNWIFLELQRLCTSLLESGNSQEVSLVGILQQSQLWSHLQW